ncbi:hypothetical protein N7462_009172 [Penicillium macrosclerotiorum]|uniref:uncharacterized protein n=1 Tax=Penicillium macrosclerotiorum TaxID=303699 RepID=UPI00254758F2|nr:uncharacterized protein N7462_009172 [Penicillium macrosclerotiorum]KAJ5673733.1 hypothetical protein N7462_009172 [Penicillium macrosclerotiorum]
MVWPMLFSLDYEIGPKEHGGVGILGVAWFSGGTGYAQKVDVVVLTTKGPLMSVAKDEYHVPL